MTTGRTCSTRPALPARDRLAHYAPAFDTVELNASFYRWPRTPLSPAGAGGCPPVSCMSVKAPRGLTHAKKLYAPETWIERIAALLARARRPARACCWSSCPPIQARDDARLDYFLGAARLDPRRGGVPPPELERRAGVRAARAARRRVLRDERRRPAVHPARHGAVRLRPAARPRPRPPLRRLLLGRRPALVGGPDPRVGRRRRGTSSPTSTTTAAGTPCATPAPCAGLLGV